jgi:hypothetical protein
MTTTIVIPETLAYFFEDVLDANGIQFSCTAAGDPAMYEVDRSVSQIRLLMVEAVGKAIEEPPKMESTA